MSDPNLNHVDPLPHHEPGRQQQVDLPVCCLNSCLTYLCRYVHYVPAGQEARGYNLLTQSHGRASIYFTANYYTAPKLILNIINPGLQN